MFAALLTLSAVLLLEETGLAACPTLQAATEGQLERVEQGEIVVTMEKVAENKMKKGLVMARIDAPAAAIFDVVTDHLRMPQFMPYVKATSIRSDAGSSLVVLQHINLPFPLRNRYYEVTMKETETGIGEDVCRESHWDFIDGTGNIDDTWGQWEILDDASRSTLVAYRVWVDPGGLVPAWANNWASKRALPKVMRAVIQEVADRLAGDGDNPEVGAPTSGTPP